MRITGWRSGGANTSGSGTNAVRARTAEAGGAAFASAAGCGETGEAESVLTKWRRSWVLHPGARLCLQQPCEGAALDSSIWGHDRQFPQNSAETISATRKEWSAIRMRSTHCNIGCFAAEFRTL